MFVFLKLGGSLITDKTSLETPRLNVIDHLAHEIADALAARRDLRLLIGHGSGSFGHVVAQQYGTREGVYDAEGWLGFAHVSVVAARLNHLVLEALHGAGVPVFRVQPSASAQCEDGRITHMALKPIQRALEKGLVPLIHGDVAIDEQRGGTIISTEDVMVYLATQLHPARILLAGEMEGVLDEQGHVISHISPATFDGMRMALGGSHGTDVTGGMINKVSQMLALCETVPGLVVQIFSGASPGTVFRCLTDDQGRLGTVLTA